MKTRPAGYNGILKSIIYLMELALSQDGKGWSKMSKTDAIWHINWLKEKKKKTYDIILIDAEEGF